ncbi:MAG TPA: hypothetical protein VE197_10420, partial [Mycobacterium sp.]|nr:hypothetical protein [Mycobacterium sp.]
MRIPRRIALPSRAMVAAAIALIGAIPVINLWPSQAASAQASDLFEITDGNITQEPGSTVPDWANVFGLNGSGQVVVKNAEGSISQSFTQDALESVSSEPNCYTAFSGTSNKNGDAFSSWQWGPQSVPTKDDISNTYSLVTIDPSDGHRILMFGAERITNNGDTHIDFEFTHSKVGLTTTSTNSSGCGSGGFSGSRTVGDLLVAMDYTNGGTQPVPAVYRWNGTSYNQITIPSNDVAAVGLKENTAPISCGDWNCRDSSGNVITTIPKNEFVEGFLDLDDQALGGFSGCINSFMTHTRSSQSFTAELKDLTVNSLNSCDANISVGNDGINEVGDPHTVTGHVNVRDAATFQNAPAGTTINFAIVSGPGSLSASSCTTTDDSGSCSVTLNSSVAGTTIVSASTNVTVDGDTLYRTTNGDAGQGGSGNLTKHWVDASVAIAPSATNEVGNSHQFTVTVNALPSGTSPVTFDSITPSVSPTPGSMTSTCDNPTVSVDGNTATCTVTINSNTTGVFTANATAQVTMGGVQVTRSTSGNSGPNGSGPATKTYVDARITV